MLDRIEYAQPGVGTVARHQHHFNAFATQAGVETEQFFHELESITRLQHFIFMLNLILAIGFDSLRQIHLMAGAQIEQRPR